MPLPKPREIFENIHGKEKDASTEVLIYGTTGEMVYQICKSKGMDTEFLFVVTVADKDGRQKTDLSRGFPNVRQAHQYIRQLKDK